MGAAARKPLHPIRQTDGRGATAWGICRQRIYFGLKTGLNEAFEIGTDQRSSLAPGAANTAQLIKPFLGGQNIRRYFVEDKGRFLIAIPSGWTRAQLAKERGRAPDPSERAAWAWFSQQHPGLADHLLPFADQLRRRQDQGEYWWELRPCVYYDALDRPKIIFPDIAKGPRFHLDAAGTYVSDTAYVLGTDDRYLLGILNSKLAWFAISNISIPFGSRAESYRYRLFTQYMEKLPIRPIDLRVMAERSTHDRMVDLVDRMLALHAKLASARTDHEKEVLQRQIDATDREIDTLVYELYDLTEQEIRIVEGTDQ